MPLKFSVIKHSALPDALRDDMIKSVCWLGALPNVHVLLYSF